MDLFQINVLMLFCGDLVFPCPKRFTIAFPWTCQLPVPRIWYWCSSHTTETIHPVQALLDDSFISHLVKTCISQAAWRRRAVQSTQTACWTAEDPLIEPSALRGWFSFYLPIQTRGERLWFEFCRRVQCSGLQHGKELRRSVLLLQRWLKAARNWQVGFKFPINFVHSISKPHGLTLDILCWAWKGQIYHLYLQVSSHNHDTAWCTCRSLTLFTENQWTPPATAAFCDAVVRSNFDGTFSAHVESLRIRVRI